MISTFLFMEIMGGSVQSMIGKRTVVTGASDGVGFAMCIALAQSGAEVTIHDRRDTAVAAAVEWLRLAVPGVVTHGIATQAVSTQLEGVDLWVVDALDGQAAHLGEWLTSHCPGVVLLLELDHAQSYVDSAGPAAMSLQVQPVMRPATSPAGAGLVYRITVANPMVAGAADIMRAEVLRTGESLSQVSDQLSRDHRPVAVQQAARLVQALTGEVIRLSSGAASPRP
jgi:NAD(P)-dependent dehydrogenase (short-subunit alcohol dehydrogenase family)